MPAEGTEGKSSVVRILCDRGKKGKSPRNSDSPGWFKPGGVSGDSCAEGLHPEKLARHRGLLL